MSERRYRGKQSRPIPVWNGVLEHRERIDAAIWEFLWLLDSVTDERDGVGIVLGGAPVKASRIAKDLAFDEWTVRQHLKTLEGGHYIKRRRTPYGFVFEVCKSRKFGVWSAHKRSGENPHSDGKRTGVLQREIGGFATERSGENLRNKEDAARNAAKNAAGVQLAALPNPEDSVWSFLEITPCGPINFRTLLEGRWGSKNGEPRSVLIGETIDAWEAAEGEKPPRCRPLFRALSTLREEEKQNGPRTVKPRVPTATDCRPKER